MKDLAHLRVLVLQGHHVNLWLLLCREQVSGVLGGDGRGLSASGLNEQLGQLSLQALGARTSLALTLRQMLKSTLKVVSVAFVYRL